MIIRTEAEPLGDSHVQMEFALGLVWSEFLALEESQLVLQLNGLQPGSGVIIIFDDPHARGPIVGHDLAKNQFAISIEVGNIPFDKRHGNVVVGETFRGLGVFMILTATGPGW